MGTVRYKGKIWRDIHRIYLNSEGYLDLYGADYNGRKDWVRIPEGSRIKIEGDKEFCLDTLTTVSCALIEGNVKSINSDGLVEVIGNVNKINEGNVSYENKEALLTKFTSIFNKMKQGRFQFGEGARKVIHLSGYFHGQLIVTNKGIVEIYLKGKVNELNCSKSVLIKGDVNTINKSKYVTISRA